SQASNHGLWRQDRATFEVRFSPRRRGSQVVRQRSAKPLFGGSIPPRASNIFGLCPLEGFIGRAFYSEHSHSSPVAPTPPRRQASGARCAALRPYHDLRLLRFL